eukprot:5863240-Amphidinium_carterae.3
MSGSARELWGEHLKGDIHQDSCTIRPAADMVEYWRCGCGFVVNLRPDATALQRKAAKDKRRQRMNTRV